MPELTEEYVLGRSLERNTKSEKGAIGPLIFKCDSRAPGGACIYKNRSNFGGMYQQEDSLGAITHEPPDLDTRRSLLDAIG